MNTSSPPVLVQEGEGTTNERTKWTHKQLAIDKIEPIAHFYLVDDLTQFLLFSLFAIVFPTQHLTSASEFSHQQASLWIVSSLFLWNRKFFQKQQLCSWKCRVSLCLSWCGCLTEISKYSLCPEQVTQVPLDWNSNLTTCSILDNLKRVAIERGKRSNIFLLIDLWCGSENRSFLLLRHTKSSKQKLKSQVHTQLFPHQIHKVFLCVNKRVNCWCYF